MTSKLIRGLCTFKRVIKPSLNGCDEKVLRQIEHNPGLALVRGIARKENRAHEISAVNKKPNAKFLGKIEMTADEHQWFDDAANSMALRHS